MPKKKYFKLKNITHTFYKSNEEASDPVYFISPWITKAVSEKFDVQNDYKQQISGFFKQYFMAMKTLGITKTLRPKTIRRRISEMSVGFYNGLDSRSTAALTDIVDRHIAFRKSMKIGDYDMIFHEFNHLISVRDNIFKKDEPKFYQTGFYKAYEWQWSFDNESFLLFNEGVTELLANLQTSFVKKDYVFPLVYTRPTVFAHSLYLICGNALFEEYFNGGEFNLIAKAISDKVDPEEVKMLAEDISNLEQTKKISEYVENEKNIQESLILMAGEKLRNEAVKNISSFRTFEEVQDFIMKGFEVFATSLFFGFGQNAVTNVNRTEIFDFMEETFYDVTNEILSDIITNEAIKEIKNEGVTEQELEVLDLFAQIDCELFEDLKDVYYNQTRDDIYEQIKTALEGVKEGFDLTELIYNDEVVEEEMEEVTDQTEQTQETETIDENNSLSKYFSDANINGYGTIHYAEKPLTFENLIEISGAIEYDQSKLDFRRNKNKIRKTSDLLEIKKYKEILEKCKKEELAEEKFGKKKQDDDFDILIEFEDGEEEEGNEEEAEIKNSELNKNQQEFEM